MFANERMWKKQGNRRNLIYIFVACVISITLIAILIWYFTSKSNDKTDNNNNTVCSVIPDLEKLDCFPDAPVSEKECLSRGCCYSTSHNNSSTADSVLQNVPYCFYPSNYAGYSISIISEDKGKIEAKLTRISSSGFPRDIKNLNLVIHFLSDDSLRIKITDVDSSRFEVPIPLYFEEKNLENPNYDVKLDSGTGKLVILRKSSGTIIFETELSRLVYADQFLQISSKLPSSYFYGIGEHYAPLLRDVNWTRFTLMNSDLQPVPNHALYGSHPFYMSLENDGNAHGVFLLNSNPMDVILQPTPAVTFRPIGGILDFFIMLGPLPENVVQQYTGIIGRTFMPPYWSLGFQLCRWGYNSLNKTVETLNRTIKANIPLDVQWHDIDYMNGYKDFTYDTVNFKGLPEFVEDLHNKGMHYVLMIDPGISNVEWPNKYLPYEDGIKDDIFIKNSKGETLVGKVWTAGTLVYPDFSHPSATSYWTKQFQSLYKDIKFDGVWIDMNEPSNFVNGSIDGCPESSYEKPPYLPGDVPLSYKTVCMTAKHSYSIHYNEHNLYAYREAVATYKAIQTIREKRPFIISRASFAGQGVYSGHWSGDIDSTWNDMRYSIPSMLNFNMYGMSMIGSDICGFNSNTTIELCARWQALGAFYPFSRNHNTKDTIEQDPAALGKDVITATKMSLSVRYSLLPYLYTLFYRSHAFGDTVARPLFFEFPKDKNTFSIDEQFLWGPAIMFTPALYPNITTVEAYYPAGLWYNIDGKKINSTGQKMTLNASLTDTNGAIRGGYVIPMFSPTQTTTESQKGPFLLYVALNENKTASGEIYWDDGDSLDTLRKQTYNLIKLSVKSNVLQNEIVTFGYNTPMKLDGVRVAGFGKAPQRVSVNNVLCFHEAHSDNKNSYQANIFQFKSTFSELEYNTCSYSFVLDFVSLLF